MFSDLKNLAKSSKYQTLYNYSKEIGNLKIFKNEIDFSQVQILFLQLLSLYNSLKMDLALHKPHISEEVINDEIRVDAYLYWKQKNEENETKGKPLTYSPDNNTNIPKMQFITKGK